MHSAFVADAEPSPPEVVTTYPAIDDEYFEWIDVLESVCSAKGHYVMVELGAGYGRWAVRAACALKQRATTTPHLIAVEAEPIHFRWLREHFRNNGLDPEAHKLIQGVVSDKPGDSSLIIGTTHGGDDRADQWYGQTVLLPELPKEWKHACAILARGFISQLRREKYEGFLVSRDVDGRKSIKVPSITLETLLSNIERIDLIDFDLQGEELKVIQASLDLLDSKTARLHIGTHGREIEQGLRVSLAEHGWKCLADYPSGATTETPWGILSFQDGVQSWINPRLVQTP